MKTIFLNIFFFIALLISFLFYDFHLAYERFNFIKLSNSQEFYKSENLYQADALTGWNNLVNAEKPHVFKKNFSVNYTFDENGFKKVNNNSAHAEKNIFLIGDSYTFGYGVKNEDDFSNQIKQKLNNKINVYNLGVIGFGVTQMYAQLLKHLDKVKPGDLVLFTPIAEDIRRSFDRYNIARARLFGEVTAIKNYPLFNDNELVSVPLKYNSWILLKSLAVKAPYTGAYWSDLYMKLNDEADLNEALKAVTLAKQKVEEKKAKFLLIFIPERYECEAQTYNINLSRFDYTDLFSYCPSDPQSMNALIFPEDIHFTKFGHGLIADNILKKLISNGMVDKKYLKHVDSLKSK